MQSFFVSGMAGFSVGYTICSAERNCGDILPVFCVQYSLSLDWSMKGINPDVIVFRVWS